MTANSLGGQHSDSPAYAFECEIMGNCAVFMIGERCYIANTETARIYEIPQKAQLYGWLRGLWRETTLSLDNIPGDMRRLITYLSTNGVAEAREVLLQQSKQLGSASTRHFALMVTRECNLSCSYCYLCDTEPPETSATELLSSSEESCHSVSSGVSSCRGDLTKKTADEFVEYLHKVVACNEVQHLKVLFVGGEPMLRFDLIEDLIDRIRAVVGGGCQSLGFSISTNGTLLSDRQLRFLAQNEVSLQISIDGSIELHDSNRLFRGSSRGSYSIVRRNLERALSALRHVEARATVPLEQCDFLKICESLLETGVKRLLVEVASTNQRRFEPNSFAPLAESLWKWTQRYVRVLESEMIIDRGFIGMIRQVVQPSVILRSCGAGLAKIAIDPDGRLWPCEQWCGHRHERWGLGHVGGGVFQKHTMQVLESSEPSRSACLRCWARYTCGGGCRLTLDEPEAAASGYRTDETEGTLFCAIQKLRLKLAAWLVSELRERHPERLRMLLGET